MRERRSWSGGSSSTRPVPAPAWVLPSPVILRLYMEATCIWNKLMKVALRRDCDCLTVRNPARQWLLNAVPLLLLSSAIRPAREWARLGASLVVILVGVEMRVRTARQGRGVKSIANVLGSNTFDLQMASNHQAVSIYSYRMNSLIRTPVDLILFFKRYLFAGAQKSASENSMSIFQKTLRTHLGHPS